MARFEKGNKASTGRPKGATGKIQTEVKRTLSELMTGELEKLTAEIKQLNGVQYIEYMMALLPYLVSKKATDTNLSVTAVQTSENPDLKNLSLDAKKRIRDILIAEGQTKLIDNV